MLTRQQCWLRNRARLRSWRAAGARVLEKGLNFKSAAFQALAAMAAMALFVEGASAAQAGDLARLRERALELMNEARGKHGLRPLELGSALNRAAQSHAEDMLRRAYYGHVSPEGGTVADRYREAGGSRWRLTAENIARCAACDPPPTIERVERLHEGWMNSPPHRENILRRGLDRFGFGIAVGGKGEPLYAVQAFAGPGTPRGVQPKEAAKPAGPEEQMETALKTINRERRRKGAPPLKPSAALDNAAGALLPEQEIDGFALERMKGLRTALPNSGREWRSVSVLAARCGGCGVRPTRADVRSFVGQWLDDGEHHRTLLDAKLDSLGFVIRANGEGRKTALAVLGRQR
jgi:uncharacterized protein YkwD